MTPEDRTALAAEAFIYGFPLVFDLQQVDRFVRIGMSTVRATPFNRFGHATELAGPEATFVSINNDTVYSIAQVDLSPGRCVSMSLIARVAITFCSSSTHGRTTSLISGTARRVREPPRTSSSHRIVRSSRAGTSR